jgi:GT2 family glycosyltransferase
MEEDVAERISLIIPTCGRPADLRACLESIERESDGSVAQIIVVDDAAPDPVIVPDRVGEVPVRCLRNPVRRGAAYCRNRALPLVAAGVDAIGFLDDDVRLCHGWLSAARTELTHDRAAVTGPVRRFDRGLVSVARQLRYDRRYAPLEPGQPVDFLAGGNALVWRDLIIRAGGFPDTATMSDRFLVRRLEALGGRCHFIPEMLVQHRNSKGLRVALREAWNAGLLDDSPLESSARARLAKGARDAVGADATGAAMLNVALDAVYLGGRKRRRGAVARSRPGRATAPAAGEAAS